MSKRAYNVAIAVGAVAICAVLAWPYLHGFDKANLQPAYRAAKTTDSSITVGVSYVKLTELVQQFNTELSIARDKRLSAAEREILGHYAAAIAMYADSLLLWKQQLEHGRYVSAYDDVAALKTKYDLPMDGSLVDSQTGVQLIWAKASQQLAQGNELYAR